MDNTTSESPTSSKPIPKASRARNLINSALQGVISDRGQEMLGGIRERMFNTGMIGSVMRRTWDRSQGTLSTTGTNPIQEIATNTKKTYVSLIQIERLLAGISQNVLKIVGSIKAQTENKRRWQQFVLSNQEEQSNETAQTFHKVESKGQRGTPQESNRSSNPLSGLIDSVLHALKPLLMISALLTPLSALGALFKGITMIGGLLAKFVRFIGPAALVISAAYAGFKLGEWLNKKFGLSDKLVDVFDFFGGDSKKVDDMLKGKQPDSKDTTNKTKQVVAGKAVISIPDKSSTPLRKETPAGDTENTGEQGKAKLLDYIAGLESGAYGYNSLVYGQPGKKVPKAEKLTDMTLEQVLKYQSGMIARGHASTAVGRYQFINSTLSGLIKHSGLAMSTKFSTDVQDKLAGMLVDQAGWKQYSAGKMRIDDFQNNLSKIWASLPREDGTNPHTGVAGNKVGDVSSSFQRILTASTSDIQPQNFAQVPASPTIGQTIGQTSTAINTMRDQHRSQPAIMGGMGGNQGGSNNTATGRGIPSPVADRGSLEEAVSLVGAS